MAWVHGQSLLPAGRGWSSHRLERFPQHNTSCTSPWQYGWIFLLLTPVFRFWIYVKFGCLHCPLKPSSSFMQHMKKCQLCFKPAISKFISATFFLAFFFFFFLIYILHCQSVYLCGWIYSLWIHSTLTLSIASTFPPTAPLSNQRTVLGAPRCPFSVSSSNERLLLRARRKPCL